MGQMDKHVKRLFASLHAFAMPDQYHRLWAEVERKVRVHAALLCELVRLIGIFLFATGIRLGPDLSEAFSGQRGEANSVSQKKSKS